MAAAKWVTLDEMLAQGEEGTMLLPPSGVSISSWLIESWLGERIPSGWY